jgi:hypothetical protein
MTIQELFEKNLVLTTEFNRYVLEHPDVAERIPKNAVVVILPEYDKELPAKNLKIATARKENDQPMLLVKVKKLAPEMKSRLIKPELELIPA